MVAYLVALNEILCVVVWISSLVASLDASADRKRQQNRRKGKKKQRVSESFFLSVCLSVLSKNGWLSVCATSALPFSCWFGHFSIFLKPFYFSGNRKEHDECTGIMQPWKGSQLRLLCSR